MRKSIILIIIFVISLFFSCGKIVDIPDKNFEAGIREILDKPWGRITEEELLTITELNFWNKPIVRDISGIEYCLNVEKIHFGHYIEEGIKRSEQEIHNIIGELDRNDYIENLFYNALSEQNAAEESHKITDISGLANLIHVRELNLEWNQIKDITPLKKLKKLEILKLGCNRINDISALENSENLVVLDLNGNEIENLASLKKHTNLEILHLNHNFGLENIEPLSNLINLKYLFLNSTAVKDLNPLKGLIELLELNLNYTQYRRSLTLV